MAHIVPTKNSRKLQSTIKRLVKGLSGVTVNTPIFVFTHHKTGTVLLGKILNELAKLLNLSFCKVYGYAEEAPANFDIVLFEHSLVSEHLLSNDFVGMHIIRDPREIIVSGYLYHLHTTERWCTNIPSKNDLPNNICFPVVPYSREHCPMEWKLAYLELLDGKSYQQKLNGKSKSEAILFEMENFAKWTLDAMATWNYASSKIIEVKMEDVFTNFDDVFLKIFLHFGFTDKLLEEAIKISRKHDLNRMSKSQIKNNKHIHGGSGSKWGIHFDGKVKKEFDDKYGDLLIKLGYV
jgi:hypothetical protein